MAKCNECLYDKICFVYHYNEEKRKEYIKNCRTFKSKLNVQEVKYGEWLPDYETFADYNGFESEPIQTGWVCSVCGRQEPRKEPYCHCGALMSNSCEDEKQGENNV